MIAAAIVLFVLTGRSETGKVDAGISGAVRTAFGVYSKSADSAEPALRRVAADERLRAAVAAAAASRRGCASSPVVPPQTDGEGAAQLAERMREAVERPRVPHVDGRGTLQVSASFGVAVLRESAATKEELVAAADAALYRAKRAGKKNRVERAEPVTAAGPL